MEAFQWGANGRKITTPEQAARQRAIAEALMMQGTTPAANIGQGLADVTAALSGSVLNNEALAAEEAGGLEASGLFSGLSSSSPQADIIAALNNPWANENQSGVARALLGDQMSADAGSDERFFGNVVPMQDADGNIVFGQASNLGRWQPMAGAEGMSPAPTTKTIDTGTEIITTDIYGNEIYRTPKQNEQAAYDTAFGSAAGKAAADRIEQLPGLISKADNMVDTIDGILNDPALDVSTGWLSWMQAIPGTDQYRFGTRALQIQGQAFLQAFESLKGGGQITQVEGEKATQAIGRLSTAQKPEDYRDALNELKAVVQAAKTRGVTRAGGGAAAPAAAPNPNAVVVDGFTIEAVD